MHKRELIYLLPWFFLYEHKLEIRLINNLQFVWPKCLGQSRVRNDHSQLSAGWVSYVKFLYWQLIYYILIGLEQQRPSWLNQVDYTNFQVGVPSFPAYLLSSFTSLCPLKSWWRWGGYLNTLWKLHRDKPLSSCVYEVYRRPAQWEQKVPWRDVAHGQSTSFIFLLLCLLGLRGVHVLRWCNAAWTNQELDVGQDNKEGWTQGHIKGNMKLCVCLCVSCAVIDLCVRSGS